MERMSKTCYKDNLINTNKGEWPGLVPCKFPSSKKILDRPNTSEDYYSSITI